MLDAEENVTLSINNASIVDIATLLLHVARKNKFAARALRLAVMAHDERYGGVVTDEEWMKPGVDKYGVTRCENAIKNE